MLPRPEGLLLEMMWDVEGRDDVSPKQRFQKWKGEGPDSPPLSNILIEQSYRSWKGTDESSDAGELESSSFF